MRETGPGAFRESADEDDEEVTVFCGDADRAVTEILERRDVARRMRVEK